MERRKEKYFEELNEELQAMSIWESAFIEDGFKKLAALQNIKPGELQLPFRIMLVGGKFGPPVFDIAEVLGKETIETISRIRINDHAFPNLSDISACSPSQTISITCFQSSRRGQRKLISSFT